MRQNTAYDCALIPCLSVHIWPLLAVLGRKSEWNEVTYADRDSPSSIIYLATVLLFAADQKGVAKVLAQGLRRMAETGTWKQWQWDASSKPHTSAASFRQAATQMITFKHLLMPCQTFIFCVFKLNFGQFSQNAEAVWMIERRQGVNISRLSENIVRMASSLNKVHSW